MSGKPWGSLVMGALAFGLAANARTDEPPSPAPPAAGCQAPLGTWATYRLSGGGGRVGYFRLALLGEAPATQAGCWWEWELGPDPGLRSPLLRLRLLVKGGEGFGRKAVRRLFVAVGFHPLAEVPPSTFPTFFAHLPLPVQPGSGAEFLAGATRVLRSHTQLMTHAGTLSTESFELRAGEKTVQHLWTSPHLPLLHLVRVELPAANQVMELWDYGREASPRESLPKEDPLPPRSELAPVLVPLAGGGP